MRRTGVARAVWAALGAGVLVSACARDLPQLPAPRCVEFEFDPAAGKASQPTTLVLNAQSGRIDFPLAGIAVPETPGACSEQTALSLAQCEFYQYLQRLDGFPTLAAATTP